MRMVRTCFRFPNHCCRATQRYLLLFVFASVVFWSSLLSVVEKRIQKVTRRRTTTQRDANKTCAAYPKNQSNLKSSPRLHQREINQQYFLTQQIKKMMKKVILNVIFFVGMRMSESVVTAFHSQNYRNFRVFLPKIPHKPNGMLSSSSSSEDNADENVSSDEYFRFLGRGENALVRPGVVLIAPIHENSHFLMKSAVFIHAMGVNEFDEYVIRGVIIDHPTPFTMTEMANLQGPLGGKLLYRGGEVGNDSAMMLHSIPEVSQSEEIGTSGVYEGGLQAASDRCGAGTISTDKFKFFFQFTEWTETQLENMLAEVDSDGDGWASVEVSSDLILSCKLDRSDAWSRLRNKIREM